MNTLNHNKNKQRTLVYGYSLLNILEDIRINLLVGIIPRSGLYRLQSELELIKVCEDYQLNAILQEIKLRAEVELAKFAKINPDNRHF